MGKCASFVGLSVVAVALLLGGLLSGKFAELGWIAAGTDMLESHGRPQLVGLWPFTVRKDAVRFSYDEVTPGSLKGKVALVTGANVGLGKEHALQLAVKGATVVVACRSKDKCAAASAEINAACARVNSAGKAVPLLVDQSSFASVKSFLGAFKKEFAQLDIFVMNAGIPASHFEITADGIEKTFHTNHLGAFQILMGLQQVIEASAAKGVVRIVSVSSASHYDGEGFGIPKDIKVINAKDNYFANDYYGLTKLANVLLAQEVTARFANAGNIISTACHPGMVDSNIWDQAGDIVEAKITTNPTAKALIVRAVNSLRSQIMWTVPDGTLTQFYLSTLATKQESGTYFHPIARQVQPTKRARDPQEQIDLWDFSLELVKGQY